MNKAIRKISLKLHLWLGFITGIVMFIVCITGCIYTFKDEINDLTQPWKFITPEEKAIILPSKILNISNQEILNSEPTAITYGELSDAVFIDYYDPQNGISTVYINQFDGQVIKTIKKGPDDFDFFRFVLDGHRSLWLPSPIGKAIVGYSLLLFVIILITGIILWLPKKWNRKAFTRNFTIKYKAAFTRINFDLHNVLGLYSVPILLILSLTGLVWSFNWYSETIYSLTSGGKKLVPYTLPLSDTTNTSNKLSNKIDELYLQLRKQNVNAKTFYFALPSQNDGVIRISIVHERGSYYKTDNLFFDQYTLEPLKGSGPYAGKYNEASNADKLRRMNLEIHDGRILGIFGKILVFSGALIGASLPITGFIIWYRKKNNKRKRSS